MLEEEPTKNGVQKCICQQLHLFTVASVVESFQMSFRAIDRNQRGKSCDVQYLKRVENAQGHGDLS